MLIIRAGGGREGPLVLPLPGVLVEEGHIPAPRVGLQVGGHRPGLAPAGEGHPQVCPVGRQGAGRKVQGAGCREKGVGI